MMTLAEAAADLHGTECKGCGKKKPASKSVCYACYKLLPRHMQNALYDGNGYANAYDEALRCIKQRRLTAKQVGSGRHTRLR